MTAFGWLPERPADGSTFRLDYREMLRSRAESQLATARAAARRAAPSTEVEAEVVLGSPYTVLAAEARHAQLLVVCSRGRGRLEGLIAGSVGVALAAGAPCATSSQGCALCGDGACPTVTRSASTCSEARPSASGNGVVISHVQLAY